MGGDQQDGSVDVDGTSGNRDLVLFTDVNPAMCSGWSGGTNHLYLHYGVGDRLWVENYFAAEAYRIEAFQFADGTVWGDGELRERWWWEERRRAMTGWVAIRTWPTASMDWRVTIS